jgi:hypothetical protein
VNAARVVAIATFCVSAVVAVPQAAGAQPGPATVFSDVLVVGGTPAGVAAALAAGRRGSTVTLVSASGDLGGVLTGAMMDQWDLNSSPDAKPIERGIFAEIYGALGASFTPQDASLTFARLVAAEPRIDVLYNAMPVAVDTSATSDGTHVDAVTFRAHSGATSIVRARFVIDATDSGDVAALAGAPYALGRQETGIDRRMQAVTLMFALDRVNWDAVADSYDESRLGPGGATEHNAWGYANLMRDYHPLSPSVLVRDLNFGRTPEGSVTVNAIDEVGVNGLDPQELAAARMTMIAEAAHLTGFLRAHVAGFKAARIGRFAPDVYIRETRHFEGLERLTTADVWQGQVPVDSIGLSLYPIDVHPVDATDQPAFAPIRHVYGIPFGALVPKGLSNLVLASPAISASHLAAGSARIIPTTIEEGEAAGAASAFAQSEHLDFIQLSRTAEDVTDLRHDLSLNGAIVGEPSAQRLARRQGAGDTNRKNAITGRSTT